eukprot:TRINITY_DN56253_c0_g1_i2.p1 TRINITY_DN56253_c0_g1~~TRINITY_DN56253_c0_g1_i2.p1  ORF type:complete len:270 (-),score=87.41 TRINITY_DN56253_c0_g1_i2:103-912(-)
MQRLAGSGGEEMASPRSPTHLIDAILEEADQLIEEEDDELMEPDEDGDEEDEDEEDEMSDEEYARLEAEILALKKSLGQQSPEPAQAATVQQLGTCELDEELVEQMEQHAGDARARYTSPPSETPARCNQVSRDLCHGVLEAIDAWYQPGDSHQPPADAEQHQDDQGTAAAQPASLSRAASKHTKSRKVHGASIRCAVQVLGGKVWCGERDGSITIRNAKDAGVTQTIDTQNLVWCMALIGTAVWVGTEVGVVLIMDSKSGKLLSLIHI